jgi:hypothetical protein
LPTIEVRFEQLQAEAQVRVGSSGLPTVLNSITNKLEVRQGFIFVQCVRACEKDGSLECGVVGSMDAGSRKRPAHTGQQEADYVHPP